MSHFQRLEEANVMEKVPKTASWWSRLSQRSKLLLAAGIAIILLAIALGLGLGLGLNHGDDDDDNSPSSPTSTSEPLPPTNGSIWQPKVEATWQIVLLQPLQIDSSNPSVTPDVDVYDIDLFDNPKDTFDALHKLGKKVICYFSAGSYEGNRPDSSSFLKSDKGKELDGWPGEYWLQLNSSNVRSIMGKRLELAASKGCDGVDPDNVDGFDNENGLDLTEDSSISFMSFLATKAASLNLSIGLKNAAAIIPSVLPAMQFSVNEQCVENSECADFSGFVNASKPVFHIEYPKEAAGAKVASQHHNIVYRIKICSSSCSIKIMEQRIIAIVFCFLLLQFSPTHSNTVCIIGSGIGGASVAHFLRQYSAAYHPSPSPIAQINMFERKGVVGGRMATVTIAGETFEAGASILHPKNYHAVNYTKYLDLQLKKPKSSDDSLSLGLWDGHKFVYKTFNSKSKLPIVQRLVSLANSIMMFLRYGFSLFRMSSFVEVAVNNFLRYYEGFNSRPVFESVEEMLKWAGLYDLTTQTLGEELVKAGLSPLLIQELVTVITRINYGQSVNISGFAGAVSLAGSGGGLWSIEGGNWQLAAGLINRSDVLLHLHEEIESVSYLGDVYVLNSTQGKSYNCGVTVVATPLDELNIDFNPRISIPPRKLQHTHATFVRGLLNPAYFGLNSLSDIPDLVGTKESHDVPFSSISILKKHENDMTYKVFSRETMTDALLDNVFSTRKETMKINWAAYPHYHAPEKFAPFILDNQHLYYVNAFENAASTMETSAVAAENIARLILSRLSQGVGLSSLDLKRVGRDPSELHTEL